MRLKIDEAINNLKEFSQIIQEDYSLDSVSVYVVEEQNTIKFGYRIEHMNKVFIPFLIFTKTDRNECNMPDNIIWHLNYEEHITGHQTISHLMDKIFELLEFSTSSN